MAIRRYYDFDFSQLQQPLGIGTLGTAIADTDGLSTVWSFGYGYPLIEQFNIAANTLLGPIMTTTGVEWSGDEAANDGIDLSLGVIGKSGPMNHVVGAEAFFIEATFNFKLEDDDEDFDVCAVGFRRNGIVQFKIQEEANFTSGTSGYTDYAFLNSDGGVVHGLTELNSGALVTTNCTDVVDHSAPVTFRIEVATSGVATFLINGAAPTVAVAAFTFDAGDVVAPAIIQVHSAADGTIELRRWRGGTL